MLRILTVIVAAGLVALATAPAFAQGQQGRGVGNLAQAIQEINSRLAALESAIASLQADVAASVVLHETFDLGGFPGDVAHQLNQRNDLPLMDVTGVGRIAVGNFTAVLPNENSGCNSGDSPFPGLVIAIGVLSGGLNQIQLDTNLGIAAGPPLDFDGDGNIEPMCFFHATFDVGDATVAGEITHILFFNGIADLPPGSSITLTVRLE